MRYRPLGDYTDRAWLAGWDAASAGLPASSNPYKRFAQVRAWDKGFYAGTAPDDMAVRVMKRIANRQRPGTYLDVA